MYIPQECVSEHMLESILEIAVRPTQKQMLEVAKIMPQDLVERIGARAHFTASGGTRGSCVVDTTDADRGRARSPSVRRKSWTLCIS